MLLFLTYTSDTLVVFMLGIFHKNLFLWIKRTHSHVHSFRSLLCVLYMSFLVTQKNSGQISVTFSGSVDEEDFISFLWNDADCSPGLGHRLILISRLSLLLLSCVLRRVPF